nr:alpha-hydroxy-acid oxidizing protein [Pseudenterobacter timonensis]
MSRITRRKNDHLDIVLNPPSDQKIIASGFERWRFEHCALPELDLDAIDLRLSLFGRRLNAPLLISSMTGGASRADAINRHLAQAAQALGLAMGVGSQRVALEGNDSRGLTKALREVAPDIVLMANLGAAQIAGANGLDYARRAVETLEADALIIHLNPLQEALQHEGDRDWRGVLQAIGKTVQALPVPVVVKEVGGGLSVPVARRLVDVGVAMLDVAGAGGTSWAAIEAARAPEPQARNPLQEALQHEGDRDWRGVLQAIGKTVQALPVPVVVKEVGGGLSVPVARRLVDVGVAMLDVAGAGGTSWAAIEAARAPEPQARAVAMAFSGWGIPTARALADLHQALPQLPLIASGGIADGIDVAKALRLGATLVGQAAGVLQSALHSSEAVITHFETLIAQLRVACFCTGSTDLRALRQARLERVE